MSPQVVPPKRLLRMTEAEAVDDAEGFLVVRVVSTILTSPLPGDTTLLLFSLCGIEIPSSNLAFATQLSETAQPVA